MFVAGDAGGVVGSSGGIVGFVPSAPSRAACGDSRAAGGPLTWLGPRTGLLDRNSRWYSYWSATDVVLVEVIASPNVRRPVSAVLVVCSPTLTRWMLDRTGIGDVVGGKVLGRVLVVVRPGVGVVGDGHDDAGGVLADDAGRQRAPGEPDGDEHEQAQAGATGHGVPR